LSRAETEREVIKNVKEIGTSFRFPQEIEERQVPEKRTRKRQWKPLRWEKKRKQTKESMRGKTSRCLWPRKQG